MSLTEQLYHLKCTILRARVTLNPLDQLALFQQARNEQRVLNLALHQLRSQQLHVSGRTNGYHYIALDGEPHWLKRPQWLEYQRVTLTDVTIGSLQHPVGCSDIWVAAPDQPGHRYGLCLMKAETLEPMPAWATT